MDLINFYLDTHPRTSVCVHACMRARVVPARSTHRMDARDPASLAAMERAAHTHAATARETRNDAMRRTGTVRVARRPQPECLQEELQRMDGIARFRLVVAEEHVVLVADRELHSRRPPQRLIRVALACDAGAILLGGGAGAQALDLAPELVDFHLRP